MYIKSWILRGPLSQGFSHFPYESPAPLQFGHLCIFGVCLILVLGIKKSRRPKKDTSKTPPPKRRFAFFGPFHQKKNEKKLGGTAIRNPDPPSFFSTLFWSHKLKPVIHVVLKCVNNFRGLRGGLPNFEIPPNSSSSLAGGFLTETKRKKC